jgi:hypothetical protein
VKAVHVQGILESILVLRSYANGSFTTVVYNFDLTVSVSMILLLNTLFCFDSIRAYISDFECEFLGVSYYFMLYHSTYKLASCTAWTWYRSCILYCMYVVQVLVILVIFIDNFCHKIAVKTKI